MKDKTRRIILNIILLLVTLAYLEKFGKAPLLRTYIELGIGNCQKIPILCILPEREIINPKINKEYLAKLVPYNFPETEIYMPKGFTVIKEEIKRAYYKNKRRKHKDAAAYLLYEKPDFFIGLFPQVKKQGIKNDYTFLSRTMYACPKGINNLTDTFFVIMKTIFTPDLGDQKNAKMVKFSIGDKKGFVTYNLGSTENYFDCNIIDEQKGFFKIYIKDKEAALDLDKVLAIISTVQKGK